MNRLPQICLAIVTAVLVAVGVISVLQERSAAPAAATVAEPAAAPATGLDLVAAQTPIGTVVTSGGKTLYRFEKDTPKPPKSNCAGKCAETWPPLLADGEPALTGVDGALVGTVQRADGAAQVTLNGWPLYFFSGDSAPGDTKGEGVGGTWHAAGPDGKPAISQAGGVDLVAAQTPIGTVVTSGGKTLYRFEKDTPKPPKSNCAGKCAETWPPLLADGEPSLTGVDGALVGTVQRADGAAQVTLNGWPLYFFSGDSAPGDTKGEGVGGTWHAAGPDGKPAVK